MLQSWEKGTRPEYRHLLESRRIEVAEVRSLIRDATDPVAFFRFCQWLVPICGACGSNREPLREGRRRRCADCGGKVKGQGLRVVPHLELCRWVCAPATNKLKRMALLPRGSLKSTVAGRCYPVWRILHDPDIRILLDSETMRLSSKSLKWIKKTFESQKFQEVFGNWTGQMPGQKTVPGWTEEAITVSRRIRTIAEPTIEIAGTDNAKTGAHYDLIVCDDIVGKTNVSSADMLEKTWQHVSELTPLGDPDCEYLFIGTRWNLDDAYGRILRDPAILEDFDVLVRSAENEENKNLYMDQRIAAKWRYKDISAAGMLYWPEILSTEFLRRQLAIEGPEFYAAQYLNQPMLPSRSIGTPAGYFEKSPPLRMTAIAIDPATGGTFARSKSAFVVVGIGQEDGFYYVLDAYELDIGEEEVIHEAFLLAAQWKPSVIVVEKAGQSAIIRMLEVEMQRTGRYIPLKAVNPPTEKSKGDRIRYALRPCYAAKQVWHSEKLRSGRYEMQLVYFNPEGDCDIPDAAAWAFMELAPEIPKEYLTGVNDWERQGGRQAPDTFNVMRLLDNEVRSDVRDNRLFDSWNN